MTDTCTRDQVENVANVDNAEQLKNLWSADQLTASGTELNFRMKISRVLPRCPRVNYHKWTEFVESNQIFNLVIVHCYTYYMCAETCPNKTLLYS